VASGRGKALVYTLDRAGYRLDQDGYRLDQNTSRVPRRPADRPRPAKEISLEIRWAVVTGVVDHRSAQQSVSRGGELALPSAERIYRQVELERQSRQGVGPWSNWQPVDREASLRILDNLPEVDDERAPAELLIPTLVDPLPHLTEGVWTDVDVQKLVPDLRKNTVSALRDRLPPTKADTALQRDRMSVGEAALGQVPKSQRSEPPVLMLRAFDFTVETGKTYRYRSRLMFFNTRTSDLPAREKRQSAEIIGRWSEPTNAATVP
jgi:hypothetical protein